ncbi:MAG: hypothetical protein AAGF57_11750 [Pseudomonadota bacterium]
MAEIIPFRKPTPKSRHKGNMLCRSGHHKWVIDKEQQFDVKQGRLVTVLRCSRCGKTKVKAI